MKFAEDFKVIANMSGVNGRFTFDALFVSGGF